MELNRREFFRSVLASLGLAASQRSKAVSVTEKPDTASPIDWNPDLKFKGYLGDNPEKVHSVLWANKPSSASTSKEKHRVVIIGGGMAGLVAGYSLREFKPVILEQADRFGGNSRGEAWKGIEYSLGAAYYIEPEKGSSLSTLLTEINIGDSNSSLRGGLDYVLWKGSQTSGFWEGVTDSKAKESLKKIDAYLTEVGNSDSLFPSIPYRQETQKKRVLALDGKSFLEHLEGISPLHPHLRAYIEQYCWSGFGAGMAEISAAAGLNFLSAESAPIRVGAGGNSLIAERLYRKIKEKNAKGLRAGCLVSSIEVANGKVQVGFLEAGKEKSLEAEAAVVCCPKFVLKRVLKGIEPERQAAIESLNYRAYAVGNVYLSGKFPKFYDLVLLSEGVDFSNLESASDKIGVTDVILANFAPCPGSQGQNSVLTLYKAFPFDGGRGRLLAGSSYAEVWAIFERDAKKVCQAFKIPENKITGIRVCRWGHPMPVPYKGIFSSGVLGKIQAPFKDRVFFAQQDNWAMPAFETSALEALHWSAKLRAVL